MVKLEVLVALDSNPRAGTGVLVNKTCCATLPLPRHRELSQCPPCPRQGPERGSHSPGGRTPSAVLAWVAPSDLGHVRNPAGSAELQFMELLFLEEKPMSNSVFIILTNKSVFIQLWSVARQSLQQGGIWFFPLPKTGLQIQSTRL